MRIYAGYIDNLGKYLINSLHNRKIILTFAMQTGGDERTSRIILMDTPIAHRTLKKFSLT